MGSQGFVGIGSGNFKIGAQVSRSGLFRKGFGDESTEASI